MKSLPIKVFTLYAQLQGGHLIGQGMDLYCINASLFPAKKGYYEVELTEQGFVITNFIGKSNLPVDK